MSFIIQVIRFVFAAIPQNAAYKLSPLQALPPPPNTPPTCRQNTTSDEKLLSPDISFSITWNELDLLRFKALIEKHWMKNVLWQEPITWL